MEFLWFGVDLLMVFEVEYLRMMEIRLYRIGRQIWTDSIESDA